MINFNISEFFKKINLQQGKEIAQRQIIQQVIKEVCNFDLEVKDLVIKNGTLSIKNISSSLKSILYIKKDIIINKINQTANQKILDIK